MWEMNDGSLATCAENFMRNEDEEKARQMKFFPFAEAKKFFSGNRFEKIYHTKISSVRPPPASMQRISNKRTHSGENRREDEMKLK